MRWRYLPPLMVYFAAGISGFTGIIESFFVKETLGLSAEFLAGLGFWAGLPWALKMPLGQVAMIPMLAWIAKEAPKNQKATYFAVMAAFTNLALSASHLGTKYLNKIFVIERGQYNELGILMISVVLIGLTLPIAAVVFLNPVKGLAWKNFSRRTRARFSGHHCP